MAITVPQHKLEFARVSSSPEPSIAVLITDSYERQQVLGAISPFACPRVCRSVRDVHASIAGGGLTGLVCECRDSYGRELEAGLAFGQLALDVPTLILVRPVAHDVSVFCKVVHSGLPALARITGQDEIGGVVRSVLEKGWSPEASAPIVRQIAEHSPTSLNLLLVIAMIAGSKKLSVTTFAQLAQMSERTLQRKLAIAGLPHAIRLLGWATILHSAWRLEVAGVRVKEAAVAGGFPTRAAFTGFIRRHAGCTASHLYNDGSFQHTLETFLAELSATQLRELA